jgi:hypothetical protein
MLSHLSTTRSHPLSGVRSTVPLLYRFAGQYGASALEFHPALPYASALRRGRSVRGGIQADAYTKAKLGDHHTANGVDIVPPPAAVTNPKADPKTVDDDSATSGSTDGLEKHV